MKLEELKQALSNVETALENYITNISLGHSYDPQQLTALFDSRDHLEIEVYKLENPEADDEGEE